MPFARLAEMCCGWRLSDSRQARCVLGRGTRRRAWLICTSTCSLCFRRSPLLSGRTWRSGGVSMSWSPRAVGLCWATSMATCLVFRSHWGPSQRGGTFWPGGCVDGAVASRPSLGPLGLLNATISKRKDHLRDGNSVVRQFHHRRPAAFMATCRCRRPLVKERGIRRM